MLIRFYYIVVFKGLMFWWKSCCFWCDSVVQNGLHKRRTWNL